MDQLRQWRPKHGPWETHKIMLLKLLLVLLTWTLSFRFFRNEKAKANASVVKPWASSFAISSHEQYNQTLLTDLLTKLHLL